jgi:hypothetical protein
MRKGWEFIKYAGGWGVTSVTDAILALAVSAYEHFWPQLQRIDLVESGIGDIYYLNSRPWFVGFDVEGFRNDQARGIVDLPVELIDLAERFRTVTIRAISLKSIGSGAGNV